jgi:hypothetical protein
MRLWTIHPKYLDQKGIVAAWREGLLAYSVIEAPGRGYSNHSQLIRFKACKNPKKQLQHYLYYIWKEADNRGYNFNLTKIDSPNEPNKLTTIPVTTGQLLFETKHLLDKIKSRDNDLYDRYMKEIGSSTVYSFEVHPLFKPVFGQIERWEIIK